MQIKSHPRVIAANRLAGTVLALAALYGACVPPGSGSVDTNTAQDDTAQDDTASTDGSQQTTTCAAGFAGAMCAECAPGHFGPACSPCDCANGMCDDGLIGFGTCACAPHFTGARCDACSAGFEGALCDQCASGFFGPSCTACDCVNGACDDGLIGLGTCACDPHFTGARCDSCSAGFTGASCDQCASGFFGPSCTACDCVNGTCDDGIAGQGTCSCDPHFTGARCDSCSSGFTGASCDQCASGYYGPGCTACSCVNGMCDDGVAGSGACSCDLHWSGASCDACAPGFSGATCMSCVPGFVGVLCDACAPGFFGSSCQACVCGNGVCSDGKNGTGACTFDFQRARVVFGQPTFTSNVSAPVSAATVTGLWGSPALVGTRTFLPDCGNNRVLAFDNAPTSNGQSASFVLGQPDATSYDSGSDAFGMDCPETVREGDGHLYVVDFNNNRVLGFSAVPTGPTGADFVLGQPGFANTSSNCSQSGLDSPEDLVIVGGKLFVADAGNNRVLIYNTLPTTSGALPDIVLGQGDFTHCTANDANQDEVSDATPTATTFQYPSGVWSDGQKLVVADSSNNRVLVWNQIPTSSFTPADFVLGQPGMTGAAAATGPTGFYYPSYMDGTSEQLFLCDSYNNRVLVWNGPLASPRAPDRVLGQSDLVHVTSNDDDQNNVSDGPSARVLFEPVGIAVRGDVIVVADSENNRYLFYGADACTPGQQEFPAASGVCVDDPCLPDPCNGGTCDNTTGTGVCTSCPSGKYDATCSAQCACVYGTCDEGPNGTGACTCPLGREGALCDVCSPGYYGPTCLPCHDCMFACACAAPQPSCSAVQVSDPTAPSADYLIDPDGPSGASGFLASCDMTTLGGGWTLVLAYAHKAGTNPALDVRTQSLPLLTSEPLGTDGSLTPASWGHASNALMAALDADELRFYGATSDHSRVINFSTKACSAFARTGAGSCGTEPSTPLPGHSALLPYVQDTGSTSTGDSALTEEPFCRSGERCWAIGATGNRWEVDNSNVTDTTDTLHRVWARSDCPPGKAGPSCSITAASCVNGASNFRDGDGSCRCQAGFTGSACTTTCPSDITGLGCNPRASCKAILNAFPSAASAIYTIDPDGAGGLAPMQAYCDMTTDGGGWTLVLNYVHKNSTWPPPHARASGLPLLGSAVLGDDEAFSSDWGHGAPSVLGTFSDATELRFYGATSGHARVIHFKTSLAGCLSYVKTGVGSCAGLGGSFTAFGDHTANLPAAQTDEFANQGNFALTQFPFYKADNYHWAVAGYDTRWEVDDYPNGGGNSTVHRAFIR